MKNSNNLPKIILLAIAVLLITTTGFLQSCSNKAKTEHEVKVDPYFDVLIPQKGAEAQAFAHSHGLNEKYCLLVDYALPSGTPRVFLWSYAQKKIEYSAHTMHGPGKGSTKEKAVLSNVTGSNCSAPGFFAVTKEHRTINPTGYFLKGMTNENRNARARGLMLHGAYLVDAALMQRNKPEYLPIDPVWCAGCVTISFEELDHLAPIIDRESKLLLLYSFKSGEEHRRSTDY